MWRQWRQQSVSGDPGHQLTSPTPDSETVTPEDDLRQTVRR